MPVFTVLSTTFNHEKYLEDCIHSVLAQTFPDWEMIILDDGSTDRTGEIAARYARSDPRINYSRQENQGIFKLAQTNNRGLAMAKGRYISILEGDDRWEPEKLQQQFTILESHPKVVVCWGRAQLLINETLEIQALSPKERVNNNLLWSNNPIGTILNTLYLENMIPAVTITIRRAALEAIGGFKQPAEFPTTDLPTLLDLALQGEFFFVDRIIAQWRVYSHQVTKMYPVKMLNQRWKYVLSHYKGLDSSIKTKIIISEEIINHHFHNRLMIAYTLSGRYKLIRKEFYSARQDYLRAIFYPSFSNPVWRLRAITGLFFSFFHKDVEGLSHAMGKVSYKS